VTYNIGINQFSNLTHHEFKDLYLGGYQKPNNIISLRSKQYIPLFTGFTRNLPESVDWRTKGAVTPVKNKKECGGCWAFAATETMESYTMISTGKLLELSTQQIISCTPNPYKCGGSGGCDGSTPELGFEYIRKFGQVSAAAWKYSSSYGATGSCFFDKTNTPPVVTLKGYGNLPSNNQESVMQHFANVGPLVVAVDATYWNYYTGGIWDGCDYNKNIDINHAVQLVGYTPEAWIVRNNWGANWGEAGYIRLKKEDWPHCGVDRTPLNGIGCAIGPQIENHYVCGQCGVLFDSSYPIGAELVDIS
jgi:cathepsin L